MSCQVLVVMGTRPEAIKLCPLVRELSARPDEFEAFVCATGQHREMLDQVLMLFEIEPDFDLNIMSPGQSLSRVTARAIEGLDAVFEQVRPHVVVVQGDTTTAFTGALAGHYHKTTVAHVEAGLRTGNKFSPFPEEMNRRLVGRLADLHFAPTPRAAQNLRDEGVPDEHLFLTGNTVIDALLWVRDRVSQTTPEALVDLVSTIGTRPVVLVTGHRRESFGQGFEDLCQAIRDAADEHAEVEFVYPVHLNPHVREPVNRILDGHPRIHLIEPLTYEPFVWLMNRATLVLTDSGGVQEEAPSLGKPVLVMRETTERPEGIEAGNAILVGTSRQRIKEELDRLLTDATARQRMMQTANPYGDGTACRKIADVLRSIRI